MLKNVSKSLDFFVHHSVAHRTTSHNLIWLSVLFFLDLSLNQQDVVFKATHHLCVTRHTHTPVCNSLRTGNTSEYKCLDTLEGLSRHRLEKKDRTNSVGCQMMDDDPAIPTISRAKISPASFACRLLFCLFKAASRCCQHPSLGLEIRKTTRELSVYVSHGTQHDQILKMAATHNLSMTLKLSTQFHNSAFVFFSIEKRGGTSQRCGMNCHAQMWRR